MVFNLLTTMKYRKNIQKALLFIFFSLIQEIYAQETPELEFTNETAVVNGSTVTLHWRVKNEGNLPVTKFRLYRNSLPKEPAEVDLDILGNTRTYTIHSLLPGVTYIFQLDAFNDAGKSDFAYMDVSMPADVPPKISWVHLLASTNETLLFGWRKPEHDNGAKIIHYNVQLRDQDGDILVNKTVVYNAPGRKNHMYIFILLKPASQYTFQVQACNTLGCGNWSDPLEANTSG